MFGYVLPDSRTMERRDFAMFQAAYCGLCLSTKKKYGNFPRFTTNYDSAVLGLLLIEATKPQIEFGAARCIGDPRRKVYVKDCDLWQTLVDVNMIMCGYKLEDDRNDGGGHGVMRRLLKKPFETARGNLPEIDGIFRAGYERLRGMEKANVASLDRTSDCFASMLRDMLLAVVRDKKDKSAAGDVYYDMSHTDERYTENLAGLGYNIGKYVYLADALDDIEEDAAAKRYNPFLAVWPGLGKGGRAEYIEAHRGEISFALASTINRARACFGALPLTHVGGLLSNIVNDGLRRKADELLSSRKKLPRPTLRYRKNKDEKTETPESGGTGNQGKES